MTRHLSRGYKVNHLPNTFKKFYGRLSVEMIFIFDGFADGQIDKIS